ncbi:MAG: Maf family nucleotide pyrophosphatase [Granulosicoccaceae bacterium]
MLILASTSRYRADLLNRLGLPFDTRDPQTDEPELPLEPPAARACRLALEKAEAVVTSSAQGVIIGSDQVAAVAGQLLHKPGTMSNAIEQLRQMSGQQVVFHTAVAVVDTRDGSRQQAMDITTATLRELNDAEIERYLQADQPLDCAGSFKVELLGISLFESVSTDDPTALVGLPLIKLCQMLRQCGLSLP